MGGVTMPRATPNRTKLSPLGVAKLRPKARAYLIWDTLQRGLAIRVQPSGRATYKLVYRHRARPRWYHIGATDAVALADARRVAAKLMLQVIEGKDPAAERRTARGDTFGDIANRYVEEHAKKRNKSWQQADAIVHRHLLPTWGNLSANTITRSDVRAMMGKIAAPIAANQALAAASAVFSWAVKQELLTTNPCRGVERNATQSRERVLSDAEVPLFWQAFGDSGVPGMALKVLLLVGQRPGEVARLRWEHVDGGWWMLPGAPDAATGWRGTKNSQNHLVWLPKPVQEILLALGNEKSGFVFDTPPELARLMRSICKELGVARVVPHDLRRSHGSRITALGYGRAAMNRVMNHREGGIADVYDRHEYAEANKRVMEAVAAKLMALALGKNVRSNVVRI
jgi:integrase